MDLIIIGFLTVNLFVALPALGQIPTIQKEQNYGKMFNVSYHYVLSLSKDSITKT